MIDVVERIEVLARKFPDQIKIYAPADKTIISKMEKLIGSNLDPVIRNIYEYSDGISFVTYALLSVNNNDIQKLALLNEPGLVSLNGGIEFMNSIGERFVISSLDRSIHYIVPHMDIDIIISDSMDVFFDKFLNKVEDLLHYVDANNEFRFFSDEDLPPSFMDWSK